MDDGQLGPLVIIESETGSGKTEAALLLSATLGSSARNHYHNLGRLAAGSTLQQAVDADYPAISDHNGLRPMLVTGRTKSVQWSLHDCMGDPAAITTLVIEAVRVGAKVLVVRNTVPAAVGLFAEIEKHPQGINCLFRVEGVTTLHHSRFSKQDRPLLDSAVEQTLGKKRDPGACIVIGTQTLEQSLDIDADLLITDLCPMDVLLQRIGRLHRHARDESERPPAYSRPRAFILTPEYHDLSPLLKKPAHGLGRFRDGGGVYPDLRVIEATRRLIDKHPMIEIPTDNRLLVEGATHPECLKKIGQTMGEAWERLSGEITGDTAAGRTVANLHILEIDKAFAQDSNMAFPTDHKIATRLGAQNKLVEFDPSLTGPFGEALKQLPIRHYLLPKGLDPDAQPTAITGQDGVIEFNLGKTHYRYSHLGLEQTKND